MKLPVCRLLRAGSIGRTLNAAKVLSVPGNGAEAARSLDAVLEVGDLGVAPALGDCG